MGGERAGLELFLRRLLLRSVLSEKEQQQVLALPGQTFEVPPNREFVRMGEQVEHACLLLEGLAARFAQTSSGNRQIIALHLPGDMVDLHSVVSPRTILALEALARSAIYRIPHSALIEAAEAYPALGRAFWRDGIIDSAIAAQSMLSLGRRKAVSRLAHLYCELAVRSQILGRSLEQGFLFDASQYHIADMLGLTPVHVSRTLRTLRDEELVEVTGRLVRILDWQRLSRLAEFDPSYLQLEALDLHAKKPAES